MDARPRAGATTDGRRAHLGRDRRAALRPGLPARLPADRQPPRRRGPHPGGLRPRLPVAVDLHARHLRGLAAPDHHQPLPRPGPPQAADPLRRALRRAGRPAHQRVARRPDAAYADQHLRRRRRARAGDPAAGLPRRRRALRRRGPPYEEIAEILGAKLGTVRSRIHRGRAMLRAALAHRAPGAGRARYAGPRRCSSGRGTPDARDRSPRHPGQRAARRPAVRRTRPSGPGSTCTPATPAATSSSARAGSRPGSPASPSAATAAPDQPQGLAARARPPAGAARRRLPRRSTARTTVAPQRSAWSPSAAAPSAPP